MQLYCGDCLEILPTLTGIDAIVTDPPYGIGENSKKNNGREKLAKPIDYGEYHWDRKISRVAIDLILTLGKRHVIFGGNFYANWLPASPAWIVWDKMNSGDFADCELVWTDAKKAVRKFAYLWNGMIKQKPEKRFHPTQKPLELMVWVLENYTPPGCTILDPFMGSGTTGVACVQTGRDFIGIEIDPGYFEIAKRRIEQAQQQPLLIRE